MSAAFALPSCRLARRRRHVGDGSHLINGTEQRPFIHVAHALLAQGLQGVTMLPQGDGEACKGAVGHVEVLLAHRIEDVDAAQVARIAADEKGLRRRLPPVSAMM